MTNLVESLKPCPFCGEKPEVETRSKRTIVYCYNPMCPAESAKVEVYASKASDGEAEAVARWNTRARIEALEKALRPFAKVADAFDYWLPEVMPSFAYPVDGTVISFAREDCPNAVGELGVEDFLRAREALASSLLSDSGEDRP